MMRLIELGREPLMRSTDAMCIHTQSREHSVKRVGVGDSENLTPAIASPGRTLFSLFLPMAALTFFAYFFLGCGPAIAFFLSFINPKAFLTLLTFFR